MGLDPTTYSEAVNSWLLLVVMPLMGQSCPWRSPRGARVSACQSRSVPPRQPPTTTGDPGTRLSAPAQSPGLLTHCWGEGHGTHDPRVSGTKGGERRQSHREEGPLKTPCRTQDTLSNRKTPCHRQDALSNARRLVTGKTPCQTQDVLSNH